jgi:hypothetical protein
LRLNAAQKALAGLCESDAAGGAVQEPQAQPLLKHPHGLAQGRLGDPQSHSSAGETAFLCNSDEGDQIAGGLAQHS